jgi:hypothetical protein
MAIDFEQLRGLQGKAQREEQDPWDKLMYQTFLKSHGLTQRNAIGVSNGNVATGFGRSLNKYTRPLNTGSYSGFNNPTPQGTQTAGTQGLGMYLNSKNNMNPSATTTTDAREDDMLKKLLEDKSILPRILELLKEKMSGNPGA